jgi:drug/metabolite transporter (DMT)-like permease
MNATTASTDQATPARRSTALASGGIGLAGVVILVGNWHVSAGQHGGAGPALATAVLCAVVAGVLFGLAVPRTRRTGRTTLILGILAVLSLPLFWSGITPVIGAAALATRPAATQRSRAAAVGIVLAVVSSAAVVIWTLATASLT